MPNLHLEVNTDLFLWSIVNRHYKDKNGDDKYELLRNKRIENGKVVGDVICASGDRNSLVWLMTNHNNDVNSALRSLVE